MKRLLNLLFTLSLLLIPMTLQVSALELEESFSIDQSILTAEGSAAAAALPETGTFDPADPGYGAQLEDPVALLAYQALDEQLTPGAEYVIVDLSALSISDWAAEVYPPLQAALAAYFFDHPESQYCSINSYGKSDMNAVYIVTQREDGQTRKDTLDNVLSAFTADFDPAASAVEQYKAIHDYVCELASYNHEAAATGHISEAHTAYGLLVDGDQVVCEGYSKAFKVLCDAVDLPCMLVAGEAVSSGQFSGISNHMWNLVLIDGGWYAVDTTWDDVDHYTLSPCPGMELSMVGYDYFLNNAPFLEGGEEQNHRSSGNIYFAYSWPMTFSLPQLADGSYASFSTDRIALTFLSDDLSIPDIFWRYTINDVPMNTIHNVTFRLTQDLVFSETMAVPADWIYSFDSAPSSVPSTSPYTISYAEDFGGPLFSVSGTLDLGNVSIPSGKPLAALNGGTFVDSDDPDLTGYLHYTGPETGRAAGWQASYDQDGRMLSFASLGTFELTMPGIYASNALPVARSASIVKQFLLDPVSFTPISSPIFPNS